jgi:hypothetical protein
MFKFLKQLNIDALIAIPLSVYLVGTCLAVDKEARPPDMRFGATDHRFSPALPAVSAQLMDSGKN